MPVSLQDKARFIVQRLRQEGYEAFFAGGCVRDMLLNKSPQDYDIATSARPEDLQRLFPQTIPVGAQFGVIFVLIDGQPFEVASFRHDGPYLDGRRPSHVRYGSLEEDILRRDFTINGMVYDPIDDRVIDLVEGRRDLERRLVRAIGERGRALRRRPAAYDPRRAFCRQPRILKSTRRRSTRSKNCAGSITQIAWERIGDEVTRILTEGGARRGFEFLDTERLIASFAAGSRGAERNAAESRLSS